MSKCSGDTTRAHERELESDSSGANAPSLKTPDGEVTTASPSEAHTAATRQKTSRNKKQKRRSADKATSKTARCVALKLPFEFADQQFSEAVIANMMTACRSDSDLVDKASFQSMTSVMMSQKPKDPFELMLLHHMAGLNGLIMEYFGHLRGAETGDEVELFERTLNKLGQTFVSYVDVLHRCYRSNGEQRLTVQQNVSVSEGGQAIIAQDANAARKSNAGPAALSDQRAVSMPVLEPNEPIVSVAADRRRTDDSQA